MNRQAPKNLNLKEKVEVLEMLKEKSIKEIMAHFKCGKSQIYNIKKQKYSIMNTYLHSSETDLKRIKTRDSKYKSVNRILYEWFLQARDKNLPLSGPILQRKAKSIANDLNIKSFSASNGWLLSFRKRHNISFQSRSSEPKNMDQDEADGALVDDWKLIEFIGGYQNKDIANMDETGLFFRTMPNKTLHIKNEKCLEGCHSNERLTVALLVFADGSVAKPIVIGKNDKPMCFKNLKKENLPVDYKANRKTWMTSVIFQQFLFKLNKDMAKENRNILLFLTKAACHLKIDQLTNIKLIFLPSNTTLALQPLKNGIIQVMKLHYRKLMLKYLIAKLDQCNGVIEMLPKITVLDAIHFISVAVKNISSDTIKKCFANCGYQFYNEEIQPQEIDHNFQELEELIQQFDTKVTAEEYINVDIDVLTKDSEINLVNIIDNLRTDLSDHESEEDSDTHEVPTMEDVLKMIEKMKLFAAVTGQNILYEKAVDINLTINELKMINLRKHRT